MTTLRLPIQLMFIAITALGLTACPGGGKGTTGGNPLAEDTSVSGAAAQALGGALSASNSAGLQALYKYKPSMYTPKHSALSLNLFPRAWAAGFCPTFLTP